MPYTHSFFEFRRDGVASREHGTGGVPAGADPGTIAWNRVAGSVIIRDDTGDLYVYDGTNWDQQLNADSTFQDAASAQDMITASINAPAADSVNGVHAAYATGVNVNFPGPFTSPVAPRNLSVTFSGGYDGGDITIVGTDMSDGALTETIADVAGTTVFGTKIFKTVTSAQQQNIGVGGQTASIGWGHKLGLLVAPAVKGGILTVDNGTAATTEPATWDTTAQSYGVTPTSMPNGALNFIAEYPRAGQTTVVTATP